MNYRALREECCLANVELPKTGLVDITFGNVSVIDRTAGVLAIKPSGVPYDRLQAAEMVILDLDGRIIEGTRKPSSDTPTHRRLYQAFPTVGSIVHTHSRHAVSFAQAGRGIPCFGTTHADYFYGEVPVTRPMSAEEIQRAYEWETGNVIAERFEKLDPDHMSAVLVHGHGPFAWGPTAAKAVENALALEIVAEMALNVLRLDPAAAPISPFLLDRHFFRKHGPAAYYGQ